MSHTNSYSRNPTFDIIKGISILFVVYIHYIFHIFKPSSLPFYVNLINYITSLAVPFFLFLGGLFFKKKFLFSDVRLDKIDIINSLRSFFKRIIIPYYIALSILFLYLFFSSNDYTQLLSALFLIDVHQHGLYFLIIYIYAFILCLFCVLLLRFIFTLNFIIFFIPLLAILFLVIFNYFLFVPTSKNVVFSKLPLIAFFCLGFWIDFFIQKIQTSQMVRISLSLFFIAILILVFILKKFYPDIIIFSDTPPTLFYLIYSFIAFLIFYYFFSRKIFISLSNLFHLSDFGKNSLFIYLIHPYFIYLFFIINDKINFINSINSEIQLIIFLFLISYFTLWLSHFTLYLLPPNLQKLFAKS